MRPNATKHGKPAIFVTRDQLHEMALRNGHKQIAWLRSRGFSEDVICAAINRVAERLLAAGPDSGYPTDRQLLEECEWIMRKVTSHFHPQPRLVVDNA